MGVVEMFEGSRTAWVEVLAQQGADELAPWLSIDPCELGLGQEIRYTIDEARALAVALMLVCDEVDPDPGVKGTPVEEAAFALGVRVGRHRMRRELGLPREEDSVEAVQR